MEAAHERARAWVQGTQADAPIAVAYHGDADGTAAAALAVRASDRLGHVPRPIPPRKGEDLYGSDFAERLRTVEPRALVVLDQGSRPRPILAGLPTLLVDHHDPPPTGVPVEVYPNGLLDRLAPTATILAWRLFSPLADLGDVRWYAAVGAIGDLGPDAPFPEVAEAKRVRGEAPVGGCRPRQRRQALGRPRHDRLPRGAARRRLSARDCDRCRAPDRRPDGLSGGGHGRARPFCPDRPALRW
jgi:single-stranded-DNA-specific exonuclease